MTARPGPRRRLRSPPRPRPDLPEYGPARARGLPDTRFRGAVVDVGRRCRQAFVGTTSEHVRPHRRQRHAGERARPRPRRRRGRRGPAGVVGRDRPGRAGMDRATTRRGAHSRPPETRPVGVHSGGAGGLVPSIHHVTPTPCPSPPVHPPGRLRPGGRQGKIARALRAFFCRAVRGKGTNHATGREAPRPRERSETMNDVRLDPNRSRPERSCCSRPSSAKTRRAGPSTPSWSPTATASRRTASRSARC